MFYGAGSAEGLANALTDPRNDLRQTRRVALVFDEFRRFEAKTRISNSALLPMVNELYELNEYDNLTKENPIHIRDGHLVFLANSTEETYKNLLDAAEFRDIGYLNRLFIVTSDKKKRVARPKAPPESVLAPIREELTDYIMALPPLRPDGSAEHEKIIALTPGACQLWDDWYEALEETDETARLDNLGMRLMGLLAFTSGQSTVGESLLRSVLDILEYQRQVRAIYRPIEATNDWARMEQKIRQVLQVRGPLSDRDLRRHTNADRYGMKTFRNALNNLNVAGDIKWRSDKWELTAKP